MKKRIATLLLLLQGCADITPITDRRAYGPVITLKDWFTSSHLLSYSGGAVLFDAGFRPTVLETALAEEGIAPDDVTHIFLTHGHGDHVGGLELFPDALLLGMSEEANLIEEETSGSRSLDVCLADGARYTFDDTVVEAIAAPGHTPGNAVYLVDHTLLLGDTGLITASGALTPVAEKRSDDPDGAAEALRTLATTLSDRRIDWIVPSHSDGVEGFQALVEYAE